MKYFLLPVLLLASFTSHAQIRESVSVYFDFDSHTLTKQAKVTIDSILQSNKNEGYWMEFELLGHCDNKGSDNYNNSLSKKRAGVVQRYILKKGENRDRFLSVAGAGETDPLNENKTDRERQLNRRVEIVIIKDKVITTGLPGTASLKKILADSAITKGSNIILHNINFVGGMHQLLPESQPMLDELLEVMRDNPTLIIRVEGHICCEPTPNDGRDMETGLNNLSEARAKAVMDYLLDNGIAENRVSYKGFGHSSPIYSFPEKSEEEMKLNRRVEIKIISK